MLSPALLEYEGVSEYPPIFLNCRRKYEYSRRFPGVNEEGK